VLAIIFVEIERGHSLIEIMVLSLGILIASVPVALPVVMQVTLALGASQMAEYKAIVTHLTAMQEIASMDVLCSDKTGTLTTAKMSVFHDQIWCAPGFTRDEVLTYAALASNADNEDDPIDVAVLRSYAATFNAGGAGEGAAEGEAARRLKAFAVSKFVGFSPETKRVVAYAARDDGVNIKVGKGYVPVVLATPEDDGGEVWTCKDAEALREPVETADEAFGTRGYKTLGVAFAKETEPGSGEYEMEYCGVVPMLDPPREDTAPVIQQIRGLGVAVKMVTGDHRNIASETCRQIGLRDDILARASLIDGADGLWDDLENKTVNPERATMVEKADGFAGVMPKDKNLVVRALKQKGYIVGMTGDGVNDAPALQEAHIGIAVEGATDAARNASDIVLTEEGLSPIATAIIESRKIFQRVRSYVLYRVSATIMIVFVLSMLIFIYDQEIDSLYIILLALLNDLTMITIAYDNVVPSSRPEVTDINQIIAVSFAFGMLESLQVLTFYILAPVVGLTSSWFRTRDSAEAESYTEAMMYLLISLSIEMLIFLTRVGKERFYASKPIASLLGSVLFANLLVTVIVLTGMIGTPVGIGDVLVVWAWMSAWFLIIDVIKAPMMTTLETWLQPSPVAPNPARAPGEGGFGGIELCGYDVGFQFVSDSRAVGSQGADSFRACFGVGSSSAHVDPSSPPPPPA
jgi:H+-transporting ATPase